MSDDLYGSLARKAFFMTEIDCVYGACFKFGKPYEIRSSSGVSAWFLLEYGLIYLCLCPDLEKIN